jgi:predicted nucleic acid-binding protein
MESRHKRGALSPLFVDSSGFYALIDRDDDNHRRARILFRAAATQRRQLVTTNFVLAEAHALILSRLGRALAARWLFTLTAGVIRVTEEDESRARAIIMTYQDKDFSYCDAASFAVMERLDLPQAVAFDVHFRQYARFEILR